MLHVGDDRVPGGSCRERQWKRSIEPIRVLKSGTEVNGEGLGDIRDARFKKVNLRRLRQKLDRLNDNLGNSAMIGVTCRAMPRVERQYQIRRECFDVPGDSTHQYRLISSLEIP